ncbi:MAG: cyclic nucleotide-binding domain-containing protein [Verrucomicrobia bacterium]|nr:cyclic nucleotide-binding domain-containing protein [Verrucomicrobiota bacterium]
MKSNPKGFSDSIRLSVNTSQSDIVNLLLGLPIFEDLDRRDIEILSRHFKLYHVQPGAVLFNEGDDGDFMAIVLEGSCDVVKHPEEVNSVRVATAGMGKLIGEMSLIDGQPRSASVEFAQRARILVLTRESFKAIVSEYEHVGVGLLWRLSRTLSQRLRQTTGMLSQIQGKRDAAGILQ